MDRRDVLTAGSTLLAANLLPAIAAAATSATLGGLAGILESGRAPAYAQGAKLHLVRWVDFVPASDEALKKMIGRRRKGVGG